MSADRPADGAENRPALFSVTSGNPTPEELAALTAVLAAVGSSSEEEAAPAAPTRRERIRRATLRPRHMMNQRRGRY
ncbi:acyl-CoA carboxylase epsilon subunit [Sinomonas sp.]|uniref:acyl-CoA carboxylase epsilon subunit n=1 Tax=Sinomonas sp. TaxID=1914986 RepID=UPI003F80B8F9